MIFRNSLTILIDNFRKAYKLLLYHLAVSVFMGSIFLAVLIPNLSGIFESEAFIALGNLLGEFVKALISGNYQFLSVFPENFQAAMSAVFDVVAARRVVIVLSILGCVIIYLVYRFLLGIGNFVMGDMINNKLTCYADTTFFSGLVKNLGVASKYLLIYVPLSFVFDLVLVGICYLLFFLLLSFLPLFIAIFLSVTLIIVAEGVKMTFTSNLMPAMLEDHMSLAAAVRESFYLKKNEVKKLLSLYVAVLYLLVIVNVMGAICTLGSAFLLTMPASYMLLTCLQFVNYYTSHGKKYFINYNTIVSNADRGEKERFFGDNEMYEKTKFE